MRRRDGKSGERAQTRSAPRAVQRSPGKTSASSGRYGGEPAAVEATDAAHHSASAGIAGSPVDLPFFGAIQESFGAHDIRDVRAHTDSAAGQANRELGAKAYATGNDIAFGESPDLHTAAHEAAHVVQQRAGVHLKGGVGEAGDPYERHADAVADKVVAGQSAEALLTEMAGPASASHGGTSSVQRQVVQLSPPEGGAAAAQSEGRVEDFRRIHHYAMPQLLRALEGLRPFSAEDYSVARANFGPRLVVAMKAVHTRAPWGSGDYSALPDDQKEAIRDYLGIRNMLPEGEEGFEDMWGAHPHNYQTDESQNTSDAEILGDRGMPLNWNTCAIRLSTMLNNSGHPITPASVKAAGLPRAPSYSRDTKQYYILAASEVWRYLQAHFRAPDFTWPQSGKYKTPEEFQTAFDSQIRPVVAGAKGIVAFQKIFGYGGTGHVDLFDGLRLSDSDTWYPCNALQVWIVAVP